MGSNRRLEVVEAQLAVVELLVDVAVLARVVVELVGLLLLQEPPADLL